MKESYLKYHYDDLKPETRWYFVSLDQDSQDLRLQPQEVGNFIFEGRSFTYRGPLESYQINYSYTSTPGRISYGGRDFEYPGRNQIMFLDCTKGYTIDMDGGLSNQTFIHFWCPEMRYYYEQFLRYNGGSPILTARDTCVRDTLIELLDIYRQPTGYDENLTAGLLTMEMVLNCIRSVMPPRRQFSHYVQCAIDIMNAEYANRDLCLELIAERIHVSKYYLSHIFRDEVSLTPMKYLQQIRINKAKELLSSTTDSQDSICERVGLYNSSYLSKLFKTYEGITPDEYRKKWHLSS